MSTAENHRFVSASSHWRPDWIPPRKSAWIEHGPFAFWLTEMHRPRRLVELGAHWGFSYMAFCQAVMRDGIDARCYAVDTWQGDGHAGMYGEEVFAAVSACNEKYQSFSTLIRSTFDQAVGKFEDRSVDLLHIDGNHTYESVKQDFDMWLPKVSERGIVLFHDTNEREHDFGVWRLWEEVASKYPSFEFLHGHGLGVLGVGSDLPGVIVDFLAASKNKSETEVIRNTYATLGADMSKHAESENEKKQGFLRRFERAIRRKRDAVLESLRGGKSSGGQS